MRIPKLFLTFCAAGVSVGFISVRAADNPAQAAARAALEEKMRALDAQQPQTNAILVESNSVTVVAQPAPAPAPAAQPTPAPVITSAPASSGSGLFMSAEPAAPNPSAQAAAQAALQQKMAESGQGQTSTRPTTTVSITTPANHTVGSNAGYTPIVAPPLPISADKQAQLQALNAKYMANQISPQDYFKQREAIIGRQ
ncbi:MAG TPA: hypothetical protein VHG71_09075 [Verrucomicrobiae bacterium]|nr:hypothetical protein [Verrucomicrobiae bacterium]